MDSSANCSVFKDLYPSYLNEELEEDTVNWIEEHLNNCNSCRQWKESYKEEKALKEECIGEDILKKDDEARVIKRARVLLMLGIVIVIAIALWMSFWIVS